MITQKAYGTTTSKQLAWDHVPREFVCGLRVFYSFHVQHIFVKCHKNQSTRFLNNWFNGVPQLCFPPCFAYVCGIIIILWFPVNRRPSLLHPEGIWSRRINKLHIQICSWPFHVISSCAGNFFYLTIGGMNVSSRTIRLKPASVSDNGKGSVVFLLPLLSFSIDEQLGRALLLFDLLKVSVCMIYTLTVFLFHFSYANTEFVDHRISKTRTGEVVSLF